MLLFQVVPGVYFILKFTTKPGFGVNILFDPVANKNELQAKKEGDVGLTQVVRDKNNYIVSWNLIFPLEKFEDPAFSSHLKGLAPALLLGNVCNPSGMGCINRVFVRSDPWTWKGITIILKPSHEI
jgi:hypothetical protein